jgi:tetratricopeptide (TPR) repeat protein
MRPAFAHVFTLATALSGWVAAPLEARAEVRAWEGTMTIPTYPWEDDVNPKFWALEGGAKLSTTIQGAITYPYVMQDHLSRKKVDRTYKALFLENEYLKVTCMPELGGRLHSVLDKTQNKEMFHLNRVIKPGMIAMRGAWVSGGVEWNSGPHGHTVTAVSPVNALMGQNNDGSAYLEISNTEQIFRTRWTVRVTLHPGRKYLDERIRIANPTDGMHPYYFWNCTAFPNQPGTRFIYPMTLGTDHNAREFFRWPVDKGRDLTWLKNYATYASVFSVNCTYDFFGAYDVDADRGIVQVANHNELGGKKAWTWGEWEFGKVAQKNLTDEDGPYIEVQSGPLPTQSDYGMLGPHEQVTWQEYWYPVHGLGDGFEYATKDLAVQRTVRDGKLELRLLATGQFPRATCVLSRAANSSPLPLGEGQGVRGIGSKRELVRKEIDLSPGAPALVALAEEPEKPVHVTITSKEGQVLAAFTTPLPIPKVDPPDPAKFKEKPDDQLTVEELYLKGRKFDRETNRRGAREYYEKALARDPGHVASLRSLAVLDFEAGLYKQAIAKLDKALDRDSDDGLSWYYRGVCHLRLAASTPLSRPGRGAGGEGTFQENFREAERCGYRAVRCPGTALIGYDLIGRALMRSGHTLSARTAFEKAARTSDDDSATVDRLMLNLLRTDAFGTGFDMAGSLTFVYPTRLAPRAVRALDGDDALRKFAREARSHLGEVDFELLETSLLFAELGLFKDAVQIIQAACVDAVPQAERSFMPLYYLAWYAAQLGDKAAARKWLQQAAATHKDRVFASRAEEVEILQFAIQENPGDAQAHLQLGCLMANLGRVEEATAAWQRAAELSTPSPPAPLPKEEGRGEKGEGRKAIAGIAWRNLGVAAATKNDLAKAEACFRKAVAARPGDQTLFRDLGEILIALNKRPEAIRLLETMPLEGMRRAEITVMLGQAYVDEKRWDDCIQLLEGVPYFVNWEGQDVTWRMFNRAHIERGRQRLEKGDAKAALADFEAALTYPANLNVGRSDKPEEAPAQFWRGKTLAALGRADDARTAWQTGAAGTDVAGTQNEYRQKCREALAGEKK